MKVSLKAMRVNANLNQKEVAKSIGVSPNTLVSWENDYTVPDAVQLSKLCSLYGCTMEDIRLPDRTEKSEVAT